MPKTIRGDKKKVLVIEDDEFLSSMYAEKLSLEGFEVITALDGEKGLSEAMIGNPDIVLLDIVLPELDGFEVLRRLRADPKTSDTPVLLLTNLSQPEQIERGRKLGATDYLVKANFVPSQIVEKVCGLLE